MIYASLCLSQIAQAMAPASLDFSRLWEHQTADFQWTSYTRKHVKLGPWPLQLLLGKNQQESSCQVYSTKSAGLDYFVIGLSHPNCSNKNPSCGGSCERNASSMACSRLIISGKEVPWSCKNTYIVFHCVPESSKGLKFGPLNHQKQTQGLKFDTLGGSRYI